MAENKEELSDIIIKFDTRSSADWQNSKNIIAKGSLCVEEIEDGIFKIKIGDGQRIYSDLPYVINGITQQQLNDTLKTYATITSVDTKLEEYASKDEIPTSLPADGGNADTVGGKSAEELIQSNPNLLLNPDFKVNQRGKSEYGYDGSDRYTVDQWKLQANLTLTVHNDYVTVSRHGPTSNSHTGFRQELNIPDDTSVTLQACVKGNGSFTLFHNGFNGTAEMQVQDTDGWVVVKCTGYGASDAGVLLRGTATSLDIKWIKLELGAVSTPFVPPDPLEEALKCGSLENAEQQIFYGDGVWANAPSNPNLLDNPDFKINQRGQSEYTSNAFKYTVDRCKLSEGTLQASENGIKFVSTRTAKFKRFLSKTEYFLAAGKKVTISMLAKVNQLSGRAYFRMCEGNSYTCTTSVLHLMNTTDDYVEFSKTITADKDYPYLCVEILVDDTENDFIDIDIKHWKLEIGSVATPFIPPNPATELLKCQRYYQRLILVRSGAYFLGMFGQNVLDIEIPLPTTMRAVPSISFGDFSQLIGISSDNRVLVLEGNYYPYAYTQNTLTIRFARLYTGGEVASGACMLRALVNNYIELSADV